MPTPNIRKGRSFATVAIGTVVTAILGASVSTVIAAAVEAGQGFGAFRGTFEDRVTARQAIEQVYWRHRSWPADNPGPKPSFDVAVPGALAAARVDEGLRKGNALEVFFGQRIAAREIQDEIDRMARSTKAPALLAELWAALGNDPVRVAECLARPLLADRLLRDAYSRDSRFGGTPFETWWSAVRDSVPAAQGEPVSDVRLPLLAASTPCEPDTWSRMDPDMPTPRYFHGAVWTGSEMIVWGGVEGGLLSEGWRYDPAIDTWAPINASGEPGARFRALAFWTGSELIVWGGAGSADPGGRFNPVTDTWNPISAAGAPSNTDYSAAVWTGSEMILWGLNYQNEGYRYRPATDTWTPVSTVGAPAGRYGHSAVWTGNRMIVWGGEDENGDELSTGGVYDPTTDSWSPTRIAGAPAARVEDTAVWDGSAMVVWGGYACGAETCTYHGDGKRYDPVLDQWTAMSGAGAPPGRSGHRAVWTGSEMLVWGGGADAAPFGDGGRYSPSLDQWNPMATAGGPGPRLQFTAVWAGNRLIVWGGQNDRGEVLDSGARYDPVADAWVATRKTSTRPPQTRNHASVWTGSEMIVLGGEGSDYYSGTQYRAYRYDPATDAWTPASPLADMQPRYGHPAVWTGSEALFWGGTGVSGESEACLQGGARYDPASDSWALLPADGEPSARCHYSAAWTGRELAIWGGLSAPGDERLNTGARYDPAANAWLPMTTAGAPSARAMHGAVWSGRELIVWGGSEDATGGRYDPATDTWAPTATGGAPSNLYRPFGVWNGRELITWGTNLAGPAYGKRYDPRANTWRSASTVNQPASDGRGVVWTCNRMIVWTGQADSSGSAYDPLSDAWTALGPSGGVEARYLLALPATSQGFIAWGGDMGNTTNTGGVYCGCSPSPAPGAAHLFVDRQGDGTRVSWLAVPFATSYDLVRGSLSFLRASAGDFSGATEACLVNDAPEAWFYDPDPLPDAGFWYLARSNEGNLAGSYDGGGPRQAGSRDAEIAASGGACP